MFVIILVVMFVVVAVVVVAVVWVAVIVVDNVVFYQVVGVQVVPFKVVLLLILLFLLLMLNWLFLRFVGVFVNLLLFIFGFRCSSWFPVCFWCPTPTQNITQKQTNVCHKIQHCFSTFS